jgi:signal transduction histidine kinase
MKIRTRLKIMTAASITIVVIMTLLLYWSQHRLTEATKVNDIADEIVNSVLERTILRSDYLRNDNQRAKVQWLSKQNQIGTLIKKAASQFDSADGRKIISNMQKDNDETAAVFQKIVANRDSLSNGVRQQAQANDIENKLVSQLLLKTYDTIDETRRLQAASNVLMISTQKNAALVSLAFLITLTLFMIIVAWSLGRVIGKGIEHLQQGAAAIGAGNLQYTIPLTIGDEFAEVAGAFNTMSGKLAESHAALKQEIEERKRAAYKIEQLNLDLNQTVLQLQAANQELEAFAYSVSHDLRAPLRAMSGFSEALVEDFGDQLNGEARSYLDEIVFGSRHMGQLIDGLLTLSRSTRGELRRDLIDLSAMADRIRSELEKAEPERRVEWRIEPGLSARGDKHMIELVMRNLLGNAWKYSAGKAEPVIRVYAEMENDERFFCVADNGAGFDMAHADKLFQPFQRLHRQDEFPGIGIGLATSQRIINRHGGSIHGTGEPGKGATLKFSLHFGKDCNQLS